MIDLDFVVKNKEGQDIKVQIRNVLSTDDYFTFLAQTDDNDALQQKKQIYTILKAMIINPPVDDELIGKWAWSQTLLISKKIREITMPDEVFLELGVQLDKLPQETNQT